MYALLEFGDAFSDASCDVRKSPTEDQYSNNKYDSFKISVANLGGIRTYGFLSVPKGPGPFPAAITVPGAGPGATKPTTWHDIEKGALLGKGCGGRADFGVGMSSGCRHVAPGLR